MTANEYDQVKYDSLGVPYHAVNNQEDFPDYCPGCSSEKSADTAAARIGNEVLSIEDQMYFYHPDHLGSSSYISDVTGKISQHIEYVPFGEVLVDERSSSFATPYLFNGKELDEETGYYYYGARYYDPKVSNWLSVDPMWESVGAHRSPYEYVYSNPIRFIDPTGMSPTDGYEDGKGNYVWFDNETAASFTDEYGKSWSKVTGKKGEWNEATTVRDANVKALVELGFNEKEAKQDVRLQPGDSKDFTKHSKLENQEKYTSKWEKALNSEDLLNGDLSKAFSRSAKQEEIPNSDYSLKFYPDKSGEKNINALGLIQSSFFPHVEEAAFEILDMVIRKVFNGRDDTLIDMHADNAWDYLNVK